MTTALEGVRFSVTPRALLPQRKTRYPLYRRLGGPQGRSKQMRDIPLPPGFDPRTVQPVASRYTDYDNRPTSSDHHHLALQPFVGFRLLSQVSPNTSILRCFLPVFDFQLFCIFHDILPSLAWFSYWSGFHRFPI